jgi:hypothetical protein
MNIILKIITISIRRRFRRRSRRGFGMSPEQWAARAEQAGIPHDEPNSRGESGPKQ